MLKFKTLNSLAWHFTVIYNTAFLSSLKLITFDLLDSGC